MATCLNTIKKIILVLAIWPIFCVAADEAVTPPNIADLPAKTNPEKAEKPLTFNVFEFKVDGNTVLPKGKIEEAIYPFLGESKTIDDVEKARATLEKSYIDAGYLTVSVTIPQQDVDNGLVKLLVTEGKVERLRVVES